MSLPELRGTGRLLSDPKKAATRGGDPQCSAVVKFQHWKRVDGEWVEQDGVVAACIAFNDTARLLAQFAKGDEVDLYGTASLALYDGKPQLRVTLAGVRRHTKAVRSQRSTGRSDVTARLARQHQTARRTVAA